VNTVDRARDIVDNLAFNPLNAKDWLNTFGLIGVYSIMFAETGLMIGFFLPGDSLLFLAGIAASPMAEQIVGTHLPLPALLVGASICAIAGAQVGHLIGERAGRRLFQRPDSKLFRQEYVERAEHYFTKFGPAKAVVLARFIPIVRTFLNPVAGVLGMSGRRFLLWNIIGGLLWTWGVMLGGYFLAEQITKVIPPDQIDKYLLPVIMVIVLISMIPIFVEVIRARREKREVSAERY
jgi:membrane-associated protein